jgi:hypothetical protein
MEKAGKAQEKEEKQTVSQPREREVKPSPGEVQTALPNKVYKGLQPALRRSSWCGLCFCVLLLLLRHPSLLYHTASPLREGVVSGWERGDLEEEKTGLVWWAGGVTYRAWGELEGAGGGDGRGAAECAASFVDRGQLDMSSIRMGCRKAGSPPPAPFVDCGHVASSVLMEREGNYEKV